MNITIKKRIYWSFTLLVSMFVINGSITIFTLHKNKRASAELSGMIEPTIQAITTLGR